MSVPTVAIDGFNLLMPHGTGVATYGYGVAQAARSMGLTVEGLFGVPVGMDPRLREIFFYEAVGRGLPKRKGPRWLHALVDRWVELRGTRVYDVTQGLVERRGVASRLPALDRVYSAAYLFERADRRFQRTRRFQALRVERPPSIMHWTYPVPIRLEGARNIYTLHDLVPLKLPYATLDQKKDYFRLVERCIRDADHIVTVSESSRNDILAMFDVDPARVTNTYQHAPMPAAEPGEGRADLKGIFGVTPGEYFLYFGAIEPKKNVGRLLEAYLSVATNTPLVIVGARAWQADAELRLVGSAAGRGRGHIIHLDYLPRRLLMELAGAARAVLFPSLYEGFGLPVLEAMQLGTPVITSNAGSLPEVAGDAALSVDPYSVTALSDALRRIDHDAGLRARLVARGREQAARFSLAAHRARLHAVYGAVLAAAPRR